MRTLLAIGIGAAAYSLSDRKKRKRFMNMIQPLSENIEQWMPRRATIKRISKQISKTFA